MTLYIEWRFGQVLTMPNTHSQALKDKATQLLINYTSEALVTQFGP